LQLFPRGGEAELVLYWLASRRDELRRRVEGGEIFGEKVDRTESEQAQRRPEPSLQQKVSRLIIERLKMNEGVISHWQDVSYFIPFLPFTTFCLGIC
jgi:ubiquinone biosynthesis protein COQ9